MPAPPAELVAELTIETSPEGERSPQEQIEAGKQAAAATGLAREAGPESILLAGNRVEVLEAVQKVVRAALDAGAGAVEVRVEVPAEVRQRANWLEGGEEKRQRLVEMLRRMTPEMKKTLNHYKEEARKTAKRPDLIWYLLLQSFATWGNSRGWEGLIGDSNNLDRVAFESLPKRKASVRRRQTISKVLWAAKARMPDKKAELLNQNYDLIIEMGGVEEAKKRALACRGIEAKIAFMKQFDGVGDKYARNVWMDIYHPDFRNSIAVDERIKKITKALGYTFTNYAEHERFYQEIAKEAGLEGWELDRLLYNFMDEFEAEITRG